MYSFLRKNYWYVMMNFFSILVIAGSAWIVFKPVSLPEPVSYAEVTEARTLGLTWLANNFDGEIFRYEFDPEINETPDSSNALRQLMASRVIASEANDNKDLSVMHDKNLEYIFSEWYREDEKGGYVDYKNKSKLGANALLLRTLVASPDYDSYTAEANMLAKGIIALQNVDGSFEPWYVEPNYEYEAEYLLYFYSGEAILALVEYYEKSGDEKILVATEKAASYYLDYYVDKMAENYHPAYVPWHTMAYSHLYALTGDGRYLQAIFTMNDRLIELLDTEVIPGRFYKRELEAEGQTAPHSSSDAVYLEGLLYAYELALENGEGVRAEQYIQAIDLSATRLVELQFQTAEPSFEAKPVTYLGAIPVRETNPIIRVDTTQHSLDAFEKYLEIFAGVE